MTLPAGAAVVQNLLLQPPAVPFIAGLTGIVADQSTGLPIPGATVQVFDASGALAGVATAGTDGRYLFTPFPSGQYTVMGWAFGYPDVVNSGVVVPPGTLTRRDLVLVPLIGSLTGIVLDEGTGQPIPGATVEVAWSDGQPRIAITSSSGTFAYANVPPGSYALRSSSSGYLSGPGAAAAALIPIGGGAAVTMQLTPQLGGIFGVVTDLVTGLPIPGATVQLLSATGLVLETMTAGPDGTYATDDLPAYTTYGLRFSASGYAPRSDGATTTAGRKNEVNASLVPGLGAISGIVVDRDTGALIPGASVTLTGPTGQIVATTLADGSGGFAFVPPAPGPYVVEAGPPHSGPAAGGYFQIATSSRPVIAQPDREATVLLQLAQSPAALAGIVVDALTGRPLANATIPIHGGPRGDSFTLTSDAEGAWQIAPLPAGTYGGTAALSGYWPTSGDVDVPPGQTGFLRLALANSQNSLGGIVRDPTGRFAAGASVTISCPTAGGSEVVGATISDAGGNFAVPYTISGRESVSRGTCTVVATHPDYYPMVPVAVTLPAAGATQSPLTLVLAGKPATLRITTVDNRTGRIIPGVDVSVEAVVNGALITRVLTDQTGFIIVGGLNPDDYLLTAVKPGYATKQIEVYAGPNRTLELRLHLSLALTGIVTDIRSGEIVPFARVTLYKLGDQTAPGTGRSRRTDTQSATAGGQRVLGAFYIPGESRNWQLAIPLEQRILNAEVVGNVIADAKGKFWFDLDFEGDYRAVAEAPGWFTIDESEDSGNLTIDGPVLNIPLKLTRTPVEAPAAPIIPQLPNTGGGWLAEHTR
ncbi:MAG TPA: carboxypeptidase regulatory-like domain-containing protein [Chloroflexota bacterium]|nr:carboxypeptidase regulatory-like domain-containing protein [Chloroflexota bacterium]